MQSSFLVVYYIVTVGFSGDSIETNMHSTVENYYPTFVYSIKGVSLFTTL